MLKSVFLLLLLIHSSFGCKSSSDDKTKRKHAVDLIRATSLELQGRTLPVDYVLAFIYNLFIQRKLTSLEVFDMIAWIHEGKYPADKSIFEGILYDCDDILVPPDVDISNLYRLIDCFKGTTTADRIYGKENNRWGHSSRKEFGLKMGDEKKKAREEEEAIIRSKEATKQANEAMEKANEAVRKMSAMLDKVQLSVNKVTSHEPIDTSNESFAKMSATI